MFPSKENIIKWIQCSASCETLNKKINVSVSTYQVSEFAYSKDQQYYSFAISLTTTQLHIPDECFNKSIQ